MTLKPFDSRYSLTSLIAAGAVVATTCLFSADSVDAAALQVTPMYSAPAEVTPQAPATSQTPGQPASASDIPSQLVYDFQIEKSCSVNPIQSQGTTGTCWCFATSSFIESELLRKNKGEHHFSEMFIAKNIYRAKAENYLLRQGKAQFSEGALAHDFLNAIETHGLVPESVYDGLSDDQKRHDHGEMASVLTGMLDALTKRSTLSDHWQSAVDGVLDAYLGTSPERFNYQGRSYSPQELAKELGYNREGSLGMAT